MSEAGRKTKKTREDRIIELVRLGAMKKVKGLKHYYRRKAKENVNDFSDCVVCGESRCVDNCHIIPVSICMLISGMSDMSFSNRNNIRLCKNHHWMFDNQKLSDDELKKIFDSKRNFIENELLDLANSSIKTKAGVDIKNQEINMMSKFNKWIIWVSRIFYTKNE